MLGEMFKSHARCIPISVKDESSKGIKMHALEDNRTVLVTLVLHSDLDLPYTSQALVAVSVHHTCNQMLTKHGTAFFSSRSLLQTRPNYV
jgi:hypothetical protein